MSKNQPQKTIAVWQPFFLGGGAEAVALWILEALKEDFEVTLHTFCDVELSALDRMYGTSLAASTITINSITPGILSGLFSFIMSNNSFLRTAFVYKTIKSLKDNAEKYDLVFSAFNNIDMGRKGIQYFHWTRVVERPYETAKWWQVMLMRWAKFSHQSMRQNFSLANSQYTASMVKKTYGVNTQIVYPPVVADIDHVAWEDKEDAFICSGRLVDSKQPHKVINIVKSIRDQGFDVKLHLTGAGGGSEQKYLNKIQLLARKYSDWVYLHEDM
ncbi:MAG: glycosyltransferase family 1 protein, partial [Bacteroidota bacterium]